MRWPRIISLLIVLSIIGTFAHYTLPQRDVVRIVRAESLLTDVEGFNRYFYSSPDSGTSGASTARDIRYINTIRADDGTVMVYRNEDTGLLWPPYFKFDSQDLQTEAANLESTENDPIWVAVTHYGWRSNWISIYPNALSIERVENRDVTLFPWPTVIVLLVFAAFIFMAWRIWERFEDRVLVPARDGVSVRWAKFKDRLSGR
ncbi:DUF1523 family protein [Jannaschia sp. CCS1]|uniref:DUF1523 family protein n=1 Tax=Jannaschia sp. (strain CCS1) TaxID=290400 RepID=UPI000053BFFE|nr:DUF1523 family protein [Jannaschia sp. CCS1]ABD53702.1 hypothetical protein Jann_0785 [Jannaschia sp. CCS1]